MKRTEVISADKSLPSHQERPFLLSCPPIPRQRKKALTNIGASFKSWLMIDDHELGWGVDLASWLIDYGLVCTTNRGAGPGP